MRCHSPEESYRYQIQQLLGSQPQQCIHGADCPVCRANKEADEIAQQVKSEEYKKRCEKYMKEWRAKNDNHKS